MTPQQAKQFVIEKVQEACPDIFKDIKIRNGFGESVGKVRNMPRGFGLQEILRTLKKHNAGRYQIYLDVLLADGGSLTTKPVYDLTKSGTEQSDEFYQWAQQILS